MKFDGVANGVLLEAKGPGYAKFITNGTFKEWFTGKIGLLNQASHQLTAADGLPVQWHFAEEAAANAVRDLFKREGLSAIQVLFSP